MPESDKSGMQMPMIDSFLNKSKRGDLQHMEEIIKKTMHANFPTEELGQNFSTLFNLLWNSKLPCHKNNEESPYLLKKCVLHGQEVECSKLFKPLPTDMGICCSFNHKNVLKDSEFQQLLQHKQMNRQMNSKIENEDQTYLAEIGVGRGLQVFVDQHSNRISAGSVLSASRCVKTIV